ncbi:MAG: iron-binding protein [Acidimicrobiales bacterium]|nr:iron-binding protein [Acidimicrobiales bacterium]
MSSDQHIEVLAHGPYQVAGDIPLRVKRPVKSELGRPTAWESDEPLEHRPSYLLCRCGASDNKPFCDGSHAFDRFDGTETADSSPLESRVELHAGDGITVRKYGEFCEHAGFCANYGTNWFEMTAKTSDPKVRRRLISMIENCPSGALAYEVDGELVEPPLPKEIGVVPNGPLFVSGYIPIQRSDGEPVEIRNRVTLCRCGQSANKPFCDDSHSDVGFRG